MSDMLYSLGASMAQAIGEEERICRGLLRLTVMDSVDRLRQMSDSPQVTTQTIAYMKKMTYSDWRAILEEPGLCQRLANIGIKEPASVVAQLKQTLVEQQSLFTMTAC